MDLLRHVQLEVFVLAVYSKDLRKEHIESLCKALSEQRTLAIVYVAMTMKMKKDHSVKVLLDDLEKILKRRYCQGSFEIALSQKAEPDYSFNLSYQADENP